MAASKTISLAFEQLPEVEVALSVKEQRRADAEGWGLHLISSLVLPFFYTCSFLFPVYGL